MKAISYKTKYLNMLQIIVQKKLLRPVINQNMSYVYKNSQKSKLNVLFCERPVSKLVNT